MFNRLRFTPARRRAVEQRELTCLLRPTRAGIVAVSFNAVKRRRASESRRSHHPSVDAEAVSGFMLTAQAAGSSDNAGPG